MPTSNAFTPQQIAAIMGVRIEGDRHTGKTPGVPSGGRDPLGIAKAVGVRMVYEVNQIFRTQNRGKWPEVYPNQTSGQKVNIAGAVEDLKTGARIFQYHLKARPALDNTGHLMQSIAFRTKGPFEVEVGSNVKYANLMQSGGVSRQTITETVRSNLAKYLKGLRGKKKGKRAKRGGAAKGKNAEIASKLGFLFATEVLSTKVVPRPFVYVDEKIEAALAKSIESHFDKFGR